METIYDWISLVVFSGLVVLFLQRSTADEITDSIWQYLPPAIGCAGANWLGNEGNAIPAILILALTVGYIILILKPFPLKR